MKKNIARLFVFVLVVVLALSSVGSAFAKPNAPDCRITASTTTPVVGEPVQLTVKTSLTGPVSVYFGDGTEVQNGKSLWHTFRYVGRPIATAVVWFDSRSTIRCTFEFVVSDGSKPEGKPDDDDQDDDEQGQPVDSGSGTTNEVALGSTAGDGSPIINNSGDGNPITITTAANQPIVIQPDPVVTQKTNWFTAFIHAFLKANEVFLHTLDESWFKPELVK